MEDNTEMPTRPPSIYLASLWSLGRSLAAALLMIGAYRLYERWASPLKAQGQVEGSFLTWALSPSAVTITIPAVIGAVAFFYLAIGIFLGHGWARTGFLWMSAAVFVWNLRGLPDGRTWPALHALLSLSVAIWYFRRPSVLRFFGARDRAPVWLRSRIPLDLAFAACVGAVVAATEGYGLLQLLRAAPAVSLPTESVEIGPPGQTATIHLQPGAGSAADEEIIARAREIVQERLDSTLAHKAQVSVDGRVITVLVSETDREIAARLASEVGKIEFLGSPQPAAVGSNYTGGYDPIVTQTSVSSALAEEILSAAQGWQVSLSLDAEGTEKMAAYTSAHLGSYLTIVEDGKVILSARIEAAILDGKGVIYGNLTEMDAKILAAKLTSGPLPFDLVEAGPP